jgi:vacuolar-type H+-ATPase subunit E/Vma4
LSKKEKKEKRKKKRKKRIEVKANLNHRNARLESGRELIEDLSQKLLMF